MQREAPFLLPLVANVTLAAALVKAAGMPQVSQLCERSELYRRLEAHHKQQQPLLMRLGQWCVRAKGVVATERKHLLEGSCEQMKRASLRATAQGREQRGHFLKEKKAPNDPRMESKARDNKSIFLHHCTTSSQPHLHKEKRCSEANGTSTSSFKRFASEK